MRVYLSHPIRRDMGDKASIKTRELHCLKACNFGRKLRAKFPNLNIYIPGEHNEFEEICRGKGYLTRAKILDVDCDIVSRCDILLGCPFDEQVSSGMAQEINRAKEEGKPIIIFKKLDTNTVKLIRSTIKSLKEKK